ncbi:MAG: NAD(P)H-dependent oxidoreductase [Gammaproteobacteria bacterium]|nr:NAD(P)H-dependent oxidoreductase [Gammaproteobacteria bacterium]
MELIYLECSPRKRLSVSIRLAQEFLASSRRKVPDLKVDTIDLWSLRLPDFNEYYLDAKYKIIRGKPHSEEEATAWSEVVAMTDQLKRADGYVVSLPMWNWSIPYKLKHYIDLICQPGLTWGYSRRRGHFGLLEDKPTAILLSSGSVYSRDGSDDSEAASETMPEFVKPYLRHVLGMMGLRNLHFVHAAGSDYPPEHAQPAFEQAKEEARALGETLWCHTQTS